MRANLAADAVFQRCDDLPARRIVFGIRAEDDGDVERQPDGVALNLHVAFLHDVEEAHLNFSSEVGEFVDGEDSAIGAGQQAVMHGELAGELVASAGSFDGIDVADEIGDGHVGGREFFHVAMLGRQPGDRRRIFFPGNQVTAAAADGRVRIVVNFAARDVGHPGIEQGCKRAQNTAFGLSAQSEQDEIMAREDRVDDLWDDCVVITNDAGEDRGRGSLPCSRRRVIRFSRISSFTRREARRCSENGLVRNSPNVGHCSWWELLGSTYRKFFPGVRRSLLLP